MVLHEMLAARGVVVSNVGVSFGIKIPGLLVISLIIFLLCFYWWLKKGLVGLEWMLVGSAVNLVDRFRFGFVRDYWQIPEVGVYNNLNDWLILFGVVFFLWKISR